jgi:hypothetical protein
VTSKIDIDSINADIQAVHAMLEKYHVDIDTVFEGGPADVEFSRYKQLDDAICYMEDLGCDLEKLSSGFYKVLLAARIEVERLKGSGEKFSYWS